MLDLVGKPNCCFSHVKAQFGSKISKLFVPTCTSTLFTEVVQYSTSTANKVTVKWWSLNSCNILTQLLSIAQALPTRSLSNGGA